MSRIFYISKPLFFVVCIIIVLACGKQHPSKRANKINKITFAVGGDCFNGQCIHFVLSVDSSLNYIYYGGKIAKREGYYKGSISQGKWDTLNIKFEQLQPSPYASDSIFSFHPGLAMETFVHMDGETKHFVEFNHRIKEDWMNYFSWLRDSITPKNLIESVPVTFETTVQNPLNHRIIDSLQKKEDKAFELSNSKL